MLLKEGGGGGGGGGAGVNQSTGSKGTAYSNGGRYLSVNAHFVMNPVAKGP